jgi:hypothetical protein
MLGGVQQELDSKESPVVHRTARSRRSIGVATILAGVGGLIGCSSDDEPASQAASSPTTVEVDSSPTTAPTTQAATATTETTTSDLAVEEWSVDAEGPGTFQTAVMEPGFTLTCVAAEAGSRSNPSRATS